MLTDWDAKNVQWFDNLAEIWEQNQFISKSDEIGEELKNRLGLPIVTYSSEQSKFFKRHYKKHQNLGPLVKEIDVIRQLEGW